MIKMKTRKLKRKIILVEEQEVMERKRKRVSTQILFLN